MPQPSRRGWDPVRTACLALLLAAPVLLVARAMGPIAGPDSFWHLALGRRLLQTWDFGPVDPLSPLTTQPWVYNQWVPEVAAALAAEVGGLPAVAWLAMAVRLAIVVAVWVTCRRRAGTLPALLAALVGVVGTFGGWDARPQLAGLVLFALVAGAALGTVDDGRPRWYVIPLTWAWACTHGTWILGIAMMTLVAATGVLDHRRDPPRTHLLRFAVPLGSAIVAALTPVGPRLFTTLGAINQVSDFISEWQAASLRVPQLAITMAGIGFVVVAWARGWQPRPAWGRIALLAFAAATALMYARTIAIGAVLLAPLLAEALQSVVPRRGRRSARAEAGWLALGVVAALVYAAISLPSLAREPADAPVGLSAVLAEQSPGTIFNEQVVGGWLYWAHPQLTPVFDTRSEVYGRQAAQEYLGISAAAPGWEAGFDRTRARLALLKTDSSLASALQAQRGWTVLGSDAGYVLLAPR
jgi:hypothetical protein